MPSRRRPRRRPLGDPSELRNKSRLVCVNHCLHSVTNVEFQQHARHVALHRFIAHAQVVGDLAIRAPGADQSQNVAFAFGEPIQ